MSPVYTPLTSKTEIKRALGRFYASLKADSERIKEQGIGFPGDSDKLPMYWHERPGLWMVLVPDGADKSSWNCFGTASPKETKKNLDIVCEINVPHEGFTRSIAGLFARDTSGRIHVLHSGRLGGNKGPAARKLLLEHYRQTTRWVTVQGPDGKTSEWIRVATLDSPSLLRDVHDFVARIATWKADINPSEESNDELDIRAAPDAFKPEFAGARASYTPRTVEARSLHAPLVQALHDALRASLPPSGYTLGNDQARDLVLARTRGKRILAVFEVKSDTEPYSIYTAIGQLSYHTAGHDPPPARILVTPDGLPRESTRRLAELGIEHLSCRWRGDQPSFPHLPDLTKKLGLPQPQ